MYFLENNHGSPVKANELGQVIIDGKPCEQWRILGIHRILPFGRLEGRIPLEQVNTITDWTFKNGKPRYRVADLDHGTLRVWGQNIYRIWFVA